MNEYYKRKGKGREGRYCGPSSPTTKNHDLDL